MQVTCVVMSLLGLVPGACQSLVAKMLADIRDCTLAEEVWGTCADCLAAILRPLSWQGDLRRHENVKS